MTTQAIPTVQILKSDDRGQADHGWLKARHSFSFANYYNPEQMGFRSLRVINQDRIAGGGGFPTHPHRDMEIFTYVLSGALNHKDSMGNEGSIRPGQIQLMSAGSGVTHSEFNGSSEEEASLLQIWITPDQPGGDPAYADMDTNALKKQNALTLFASGDGRDGSQKMRQDAEIFFGNLEQDASLPALPDGEFDHHYLQLIKGSLHLEGQTLLPGDAVMIDGKTPTISALQDSEFLYFNL